MLVDGHVHLTEPVDLILRRLEQAGIDKAVVCSSGLAKGEEILSLQDAKQTMDRIARAQHTPDPGLSIQNINVQMVDIVTEHKEELYGFGKADIFSPELLNEAQEIFKAGLQGIGEIIGIHGNAKLVEPLLQFSHEQGGFPLFIHCDYPVDANDLHILFDLAKKFKKARMVIGHLGGDFWIEAIEKAFACSNVYLDTSEVVNGTALQVAVRELPERVIFGSDFPWDSPEAMLRRFDFLDMDSGVKKRILGLNILEVLGVRTF